MVLFLRPLLLGDGNRGSDTFAKDDALAGGALANTAIWLACFWASLVSLTARFSRRGAVSFSSKCRGRANTSVPHCRPTSISAKARAQAQRHDEARRQVAQPTFTRRPLGGRGSFYRPRTRVLVDLRLNGPLRVDQRADLNSPQRGSSGGNRPAGLIPGGP